MPTIGPRGVLAVVGAIAALVLGGCGAAPTARVTPPVMKAPSLGDCHSITAEDLASRVLPADTAVACSARHTAQTFLVDDLPESTGPAYDNRRHGAYVFKKCQKRFEEFVGADESLAMRSWLSWAWFGPDESSWDRGARWFHCVVVGGPDGATELRRLPADVEGVLDTDPEPDEWLTCARGSALADAKRLPCSEPHDWRAIATIKVGQPADAYPGDRVVEVRTRERCADWISAWTDYAADFEFGFTTFHREEWQAGNRRSVCWARTGR